MSDPNAPEAVRAALLERRRQVERRVGRVQSDVRHQDAPLEADSEEQVVQVENDPVLDALDASGRRELEEIDRALARLEAGDYGTCERCGEAIPAARLRVQPAATTCAACTP
jgi:RNA polymerase-binding transcription factor DksA